MNEPDNGPKIPIPGHAGALIYAALRGLSMHCGEAQVTIRKVRQPNGGYVYTIANNQSPARPASKE